MSIIKLRAKMGTTMKIVLVAVAAILLVGIFFSFAGPPSSSRQGGFAQGAGPAVIAKVNGKAIQRAEFLRELVRDPQYSQDDLLRQPYLYISVFNNIVDRILNLQAANAEGVKPSRADVDAEREQLIDAIINRRYPSKRQLKRAVIAVGSKDKLRKSVQQEPGFPSNDLLRQSVMFNKLREKIQNSVQVTDEDLKESFEEVKARHILIAPDKVQPPKGKKPQDLTADERDSIAKAKAEKLRKQIAEGADFAALARKESDDPGTRDKGGELGWFKRGQMAKEFEEAAFSLNAGQVSGVVKTPFGYHIIKVEAERTNLPKDFEKNKEFYKNSLLRRRQAEAWSQYEKRLKETATIEILDPVLKAFTLLEPDPDTGEPPTPVDQQQAIALLEQARQDYAKSDPLVNFQLGQLYEQANRIDDAIAAYETASESGVTSPSLALALGKLYQKKGKTKEALEQFTLASDFAAATQSDMGPDYRNYFIHIQLKSIYKDMHKADLAKVEDQWLQRFTTESQQQPSAPVPIGSG